MNPLYCNVGGVGTWLAKFGQQFMTATEGSHIEMFSLLKKKFKPVEVFWKPVEVLFYRNICDVIG